jgi:TolA-binding protein
MAIFRKKADPISARSKELEEQIRALESEIKQLSGKIDHSRTQPRVRSTTAPHRSSGTVENVPAAAPSLPPDPVFERLNYQKSKGQPEIESTTDRYNDLGVRKYDLVGALRRLQKHFRGNDTANPKLINYLAAGSIKGLRPLRYEKRIARNRFIFLSLFFALILWGIIAAVMGPR